MNHGFLCIYFLILIIVVWFVFCVCFLGGYAWDLTDHSFAYAQYGITGWSCGAWWVGLACIVAGVIGVVCIDRDWLIATCALSCAAMLISVAGAVIDGIYATWYRNIQTCVNWNGTGGITSATISNGGTYYWPTGTGTISQGWQFSGANMYSTDALYCYTSLSGNANRVFTLTGTQTISATAMQLISRYMTLNPAGIAPCKLFYIRHHDPPSLLPPSPRPCFPSFFLSLGSHTSSVDDFVRFVVCYLFRCPNGRISLSFCHWYRNFCGY